MAVIHVAKTGNDTNGGTSDAPVLTIQRGAELARPGDTVLVREGTYREWVRPVRGGLSDTRRIVFEAAPGEDVTIKGSEIVRGWVRESGSIWRADLPTSLFGDFNPYVERVQGDWIVPPSDGPHPGVVPHLGEVYLNGGSFYEVFSREALDSPQSRTHAYDHWSGKDVALPDPQQTVYVWYTETHGATTSIWANFQDADPNDELVEINVRPAVFFPTRNHLDYITVRGFRLAQAASPWTPPTADQPGLIGPNWAKGWIIEDNVIHDAKCSAVSIGKEWRTGHNLCSERGDKPGYQYQLETVFTAREYGWSREHVGSHIIRRNEIFNSGQNGIVGHLGCVFSTIEDNHIYNIATKKEFYGYEIAGIKLHAPLDVQIVQNRIHGTTLGIWLDWQVQGTRISRNLMYGNGRDLFIEVCHGPTAVDHNVFASPIAIELFSQGNAFINNLVAGSVRTQSVLDRATPYHRPHSTAVKGYAFHYSGDDRYFANLFVGAPGGAYNHERAIPRVVEGYQLETYGTHAYDGFPGSFEEYLAEVGAYDGVGDHARFHFVKQPAYIQCNAYAGGAKPAAHETSPVLVDDPVGFQVIDEGAEVYLDLTVPQSAAEAVCGVVTGADLGRLRIVDAEFENPDGTPLRAQSDLTGAAKAEDRLYPTGPIADLKPGRQRIRVWSVKRRSDHVTQFGRRPADALSGVPQ